ncbi:putative oligopeptide transporter subunit; permease component of ABC superfamily [uncultured Alphaproteobacteria bacterium]|uniref:Putative oligopeptide transporter subunit permease component of ABC superfamily n=1 Tax=uncultured Alphaproteobacteria bacterium TaxID=91750 RepID=A0A212KKW1_9PROT|nr:putative oligopeptide transporter subunit; permease component of ABC superfamily [uncultured Alphaproteobacteria bacterium]
MLAYVVRRLLLIPLTLLGIIAVNFVFVQLAPGGPIEQILARLEGQTTDATARFSGTGAAETARPAPGQGSSLSSKYRGAQGLDPAFIAHLEHQMGFDKPPAERFWLMVKSYARFDLGKSYFRDASVLDLILEKLPVSASLGIWSTLIIYLISIPLGVRKAVRDGSRFDVASSWAIIVGHAIPGFLFAILLIIVFAGGRYLNWFPLRGLTSDDWADLSWPMRILDYAWHMALPVAALVIGGFASLTMLTKNAFLEEINKQYVLTARAKGLSEHGVLYGHVFRNAMLVVIAGFPATLIGMLFTGSVLIEVIFSLDGIGLLGFEAAMNRDYPVMFGTLYAFSLLGLVLGLISDLTYHFVDPRIDFAAREA